MAAKTIWLNYSHVTFTDYETFAKLIRGPYILELDPKKLEICSEKED